MRGRRSGIQAGAALLVLLLIAPSGLSVTGSGQLATRFPVQLWGPLDASAPRGGLTAHGGAFAGTLQLIQGQASLITFELPQGLLGGDVRRSVQVLAGPGSLLELHPRDAGQLFAEGPSVLHTHETARLLDARGTAFAAELGNAALTAAYPPGAAAVEATQGSATASGVLHVLLTEATVRVRQGALGLVDVDLGTAPGVAAGGVSDGGLTATAAVPGLAERAAGTLRRAQDAPWPELPVDAGGVLVRRVLEVQGEGILAVASTGALLRVFDRAPAIHVAGGAASFPGAQGEIRLGGRDVLLRGDRASASGDYWIFTGHEARGGGRQATLQGRFDSFAVNGAAVNLVPENSGALALAGLAALGMASPLLRPLAGKLGGVLYARIPASEVLGSGPRRRIFELIQREPGLSLSEIAQREKISWGATVHHLDTLRRNGFVVSMRHGRYRRWFASGGLEVERRTQVSALRNTVSAAVARAILAQPGLSQKQLADRLAMSPQAVHWHLVRLEQAGLVERRRDGREVKHFVRAATMGIPAPAPGTSPVDPAPSPASTPPAFTPPALTPPARLPPPAGA